MEYIGTILIIILVIIVAIIYNILTTERNKVKREYANLEVQLKKRWDLVPNLVEIVKEYSVYEESTLQKLTVLRSQSFDSFKMEQKINVDQNIAKVISKMMGIAENYPDLKANEEYLNLSEQLIKLETGIENSRKEYNQTVQKYNTEIEKLPNNLVAILFGFNEEPFFQANDEEKQSIKIKG